MAFYFRMCLLQASLLFLSVSGALEEYDTDVTFFLDVSRRREVQDPIADRSDDIDGRSPSLRAVHLLHADAKRKDLQMSTFSEELLLLDMLSKLNDQVSALDINLDKNAESARAQEELELSTRQQLEEKRQFRQKIAQELGDIQDTLQQKEQEMQVVRKHHETVGHSAAVALINTTKLGKIHQPRPTIQFDDQNRVKHADEVRVKLEAAQVANIQKSDALAKQMQPWITQRDQHRETYNALVVERQKKEELMARQQSDENAWPDPGEHDALMREIGELSAREAEEIEIQKQFQSQIDGLSSTVADVEAEKAQLLLEHDQILKDREAFVVTLDEHERWYNAIHHLEISTRKLYEELEAEHHLVEQDLSRLERETEDLLMQVREHEHLDTEAAETMQEMRQKLMDAPAAVTKTHEEATAMLSQKTQLKEEQFQVQQHLDAVRAARAPGATQ